MKTNYWLKRQSDKRLFTSEELGKVAMSQSVAIYEQALRNVNSDIASIYRNYSKESGVDINLLQQILNGSDRASFLKSVKTSMVKFGLDATKIYSPEYLGRLSRLEALKEQLYWEIVSIAPDELDATGARYAEIVARTYGQTQLDLQHTGMSPTFSHINKSAIVDVLNSKWAGRNYSDSIWRNVNGLASDLPQIIGGGLTSGTSQEKMARQVRERYDVSVYESMRLIRTESNYFLNEAEGQSYEEREIEEYEYDAVPDSIRFTCNCFENDGLIFNVKDRIPGRNYPPLHPNCRCGTLPVLKGMKEEVDPKRAKTYNMPDRVERYAQDANSKVSSDIKERWKKAMTKQKKVSRK